MRGLTLFASALLTAAAAAPAHAELDRAAMIALASGSVLKIEAVRGNGAFSLGSGVAIAEDRVVTNCHVTRDAQEIRIVRGGVRWRVQTQMSDAYHDLCVLKVPGLVAEPVKMGQAGALAIGQSVTALGYTGGIEIQSSGGEVLSLHRMDGANVVQSSNFFNSGASGGGLFDDQLRLVGILSFRLRGGEAHYFAAPSEWLLRQLADRDREHDLPVKPLDPKDLAFWQIPLDAQPMFLRAAVLERDNNWLALEPLTQAWSQADPTDPEPWYVMSLTFDRLGRSNAAVQALECSLSIDPGYPPARAQMAPMLQRRAINQDTAVAALPCSAKPH